MTNAKATIARATPAKRRARRRHDDDHEGADGASPSVQAAVGNHAMSQMLHRKPASAKTESEAAQRQREDAAVLGMHVSMVLSDPRYSKNDTAGLESPQQAFIEHLYQAVYDRRFDRSHDNPLDPNDREGDLVFVQTMMPVIAMQLGATADGRAALAQLRSRIHGVTQSITRNAVVERAHDDAALGAELLSPEVQAARLDGLDKLRQTAELYSKFSKIVQGSSPEQSAAGGNTAVDGWLTGDLKLLESGMATTAKVLKATNPAEYRKVVADARKWCQDHGAAMGIIKGVQVEAELVELTAGTAVAVGKTLSSIAMRVFTPTGSNLELLKELEASGELLSGAGRTALRFDKVAGFLEKAESALAVVAIAGGAAKMITADTTFERIDAGVDIGTGGLTLAAKLTGRFGFGAAASGALLTWEYVKFIGNEVSGAIEGSLYGGLWEELRAIEARGDEVGTALTVLTSVLDERGATEGASGDPRSAGMDEAADDMAYRLQKVLAVADHRWQASRIDALARHYPDDVKKSVAFAGQPGYPPDLIAASALEFLSALTKAYMEAAEIVIDMAVDQGYLSEEKALKQKEKLHEAPE